MHTTILTVLIALCHSVFASTQSVLPPVAYPLLPAHGDSASDFVPEGWKLERSIDGDLNADGREDLLLLLRMTDPANVVTAQESMPTVDTNPRMLAAFFAEPAGGYRLEMQNHTLIPRAESFFFDDFLGSPDAISVRRGTLRVTLHLWASAGSWTTSRTAFTFRYQEACFRLIGYDYDEIHRGNGETSGLSVNYLTRRFKRTRGNIEVDTTEESWARLKKQPLRCLSRVGNGLEFDPGIP